MILDLFDGITTFTSDILVLFDFTQLSDYLRNTNLPAILLLLFQNKGSILQFTLQR